MKTDLEEERQKDGKIGRDAMSWDIKGWRREIKERLATRREKKQDSQNMFVAPTSKTVHECKHKVLLLHLFLFYIFFLCMHTCTQKHTNLSTNRYMHTNIYCMHIHT